MDLSKLSFKKLLILNLIIFSILSLGVYFLLFLFYPDEAGFLGFLSGSWIQVILLLSKIYFMRGDWKQTVKPQLILTGFSLFMSLLILGYFSFFQKNLSFLVGFLIANYFTMKIFVSFAYLLLRYDIKND